MKFTWEVVICAGLSGCWTALSQHLLQVSTGPPLSCTGGTCVGSSGSVLYRLMSRAECKGWKSSCLLGGFQPGRRKLLWCRCVWGRLLRCTFLPGLHWGLSASSSSSLTSSCVNMPCLLELGTFLWDCLTGSTGAARWLWQQREHEEEDRRLLISGYCRDTLKKTYPRMDQSPISPHLHLPV